MNEIVTDIFTWAWFSEPHGYNFNGYLVRHPDGNLCIDPVPPSDETLAEIARMGVAKILLTNRNHSRAANVVRERTGARTLIHPDDAAHARSQGAEIDGELEVGEKIGPLTIVAAPGKSPGEVALHWPERKLPIVGDVVIGNPPGHCGLLREKVMDDTRAPQARVRALLELEFDTLPVDDMLDVMGTFRRGGTIMSQAAAQTMLDASFGIDLIAVDSSRHAL